MNPHKRQTIEKLIVQQSGAETLDLNDIVLGYQGARIVASLLPQYHKTIRHIKLSGNNLDSQSFTLIFSALLHSPHLKSIHAEWNHLGSSQSGLASLCHLVQNSQHLEFIDLKNNRISHHLAHFLAEILETGRGLRVLDLRWNQIGEIGAKQILGALGGGSGVRFIGLEDNRISMATLMEIQNILKGGRQGGPAQPRVLKHSLSQPSSLAQQPYPISQDLYPSMDSQLRTAELRSKIQNEQKQNNRYTDKLQIQIQKVLQKIKLKGAQIAQVKLKHDALMSQNGKISEELREAQRMLALEKERVLGIGARYGEQMSQMRNQRYRLNNNIQTAMQKYSQRNQRELDQIQLVMTQKSDRLHTFLKQRLFQTRQSRQKLTQLKQDILKHRINKQELPNRQITGKNISALKSGWDQEIFALKEEIAGVTAQVQSQIKKGEYMGRELNGQVCKALAREQGLQGEIFGVQNKIKGMHNQMAIKNLEMQRNLVELRLKESEIFDKQTTIQMESRYLKYLHSEGNVKFQIYAMIAEQLQKGSQKSEQGIESRIAQVQRALRAQQAQNRMIKNQYEKLLSQLENITKKNIQLVLFQ